MRVVVQRVTRAHVAVADEIISSIERGLCILVGICRTDQEADLDYIKKKILSLRLWPDENDRPWARSVSEIDGSILLVSQFTLHADISKGTKPNFVRAMPGGDAQPMYARLLEQLGMAYNPTRIHDGAFGEMMQVHIENDGPMTLIFDSESKKF